MEDKHFKIEFILGAMIIASFLLLSYINEDKGKYDYCVEWDGYIQRDNLMMDCYNIETHSLGCMYGINDTSQKLYVQQVIYNNATQNYTTFGNVESYGCTRYVKSLKQ